MTSNARIPEAEAGRRGAAARLIIADDHELARAGLRSMISGEPGLEIVGEATNGREALELARRHEPDLALLDMRMPEMDGLAATRAIKQECPKTAVVIVTMHENPDYLFEALKAGAAGYLLKDASQREVVTAVRRVLRGESLLNQDLATQLLRRLAGEASGAGGARPPERLTPREHEVLRLLAQGQTNREIAKSLVVSVGTVKVHVEHIIAKLGVSDRTQAAVRAVELGLLGTPSV
jgi:DNA-binding NarL/FixJ family response regulator